ncbi:hypothetical protein, partial [Aliarcobacter butzleri]|uniref:hypothetical protein n=1 Tax=Aliarcobacter butzleri TaxID=28197 RepID=UPI0036F45617|nr:hypothetical protein [Aliarcobacter butzleri]
NSKIESLSEMILVQISKQSFLERRNSSLFNCNYDSFGNEFCPSNLAKAESYWDYDNGFSIPKVGQVADYTNKETTNKTTYTNPTNFFQVRISYATINNGSWSDVSNNGVLVDSYHNNDRGGVEYVFLRLNDGKLQVRISYATQNNGSWSDVNNNGVLVDSYHNNDRGGVEYVFLRLNITCSSGEILENNQCKKIEKVTECPVGYTETTGAEVAKGECKGNIDYSYYEYKCNEEKNGQNNNYQIINNGGDCNKSDTNNKTVNPELSNSCNSSTPPVNNCKRQGFKCNSNEIKPVYVNGEWQCSPFLCDSNMKCGYATCNSPSIPSTSKFQDVAYNPLNYIYNNKCNQDICDYVLNAQVSYCESSQCPKRDDVIEKNGLCYKMECPAGTYLSGDKCIKENF